MHERIICLMSGMKDSFIQSGELNWLTRKIIAAAIEVHKEEFALWEF